MHGLAVICADIAARRDTFLLEAEHIAAVPISMERHVEGFTARCDVARAVPSNSSSVPRPRPSLSSSRSSAILELYKRGVIKILPGRCLCRDTARYRTDAPEITDFSVPDWGMPDDPSLEQFDEDDAGETMTGEMRQSGRRLSPRQPLQPLMRSEHGT